MLWTLRVCVFLLLVFSLASCAEPPHKEMNQAHGAIDAARAAGAEQYAAAELAAATTALQRSEEAVAQSDYRLALSLAIDSRERAQQAAKVAVDNRAKARGDAERILAETNSELTQVRRRFDEAALAKLPRRTASDIRTALTSADTTMQEARAALAKDDYDRAIAAARSVSTRIQAMLAAVDKTTTTPAPRKRR